MAHMRASVIAMTALALVLGCVEEPEVCEVDEDYAYDAGAQWGPCLPDGTCTEGHCHQFGIGTICTPNGSCQHWTHPSCEPTVRTMYTDARQACAIECDETDASVCPGESVCDPDWHLCLWPSQ